MGFCYIYTPGLSKTSITCSESCFLIERMRIFMMGKRLFYVAIARAEKELYLTHSHKRNDSEYSASPFIQYLGDTVSVLKSKI